MSATNAASLEDRTRAAEIGTAAITAFYGGRLADIEGDSEFLSGYFHRLLQRAGYSSVSVSTRPKKLKSAVEKIRSKCADPKSNYCNRILSGEPPERILTDLIGVRLTCKFSDQIDEVAALIGNNCALRDSERADHRKPEYYGTFGYAALHLVAEPITASPAIVYYSGCAFEVQIRSALMDIWGVVNWDIAYTGEKDLPYELLRRMSTLSALFYLIDQEFIRIREEASQRERVSLLSAESEVPPFEFSDSVATALSKRGITFGLDERRGLIEHRNNAERYIAKSNGSLDGTPTDALALYLFDRERFAWIVDGQVSARVEDIDRISRAR